MNNLLNLPNVPSCFPTLSAHVRHYSFPDYSSIDYRSAITGVVNLAIEVTGITHAYFREVRISSKDVKEFDAALAGLSEVLMQLERLLKLEQAQRLVFEETPALFSTHQESKIKLEDVLSKLRLRLQDHEAFRVARHLTWPLASKEHR